MRSTQLIFSAMTLVFATLCLTLGVFCTFVGSSAQRYSYLQSVLINSETSCLMIGITLCIIALCTLFITHRLTRQNSFILKMGTHQHTIDSHVFHQYIDACLKRKLGDVETAVSFYNNRLCIQTILPSIKEESRKATLQEIEYEVDALLKFKLSYYHSFYLDVTFKN